jgi:ABC-type transport system involved in cytochrome c biogenesis ATPase subunit
VLGGLIAAHRAAGGIAVVATHLPIRMQGAREILIGGGA